MSCLLLRRYVDLRTLCGFNALHFCAILDHTEVLQELISHHANIIAPSLYECTQWTRFSPGTTPLHVAASEGQTLACKILLKAHVSGKMVHSLLSCLQLVCSAVKLWR